MNFLETLEKIEDSSPFKNFKEQHSDLYLCAGFFVLDYVQQANQQQLDYSLKNGTIYTFICNNEITMKKAETIEGQKVKLPKLDKDFKVDLDDVEKIIKEQAEKKINKIIAVLQKHENKQIWNLNCMLEGMGILQIHIDSDSGDLLKKEEKSMFDFIKRVK